MMTTASIRRAISRSSLGAAVLFAPVVAAAAGSFPTGVYIGNARADDPAAMATFKRDFDSHVAAMHGARPKFFNTFTDFRRDPADWPASARRAAGGSAKSGKAYLGPESGMIPLVGLPLASSKGGWKNVAIFYQETVAGDYDKVWTGIVDAYADAGYRTVDFRIAYEMNGNFMPWAPGNSKDPTARSDFVAAFRHVADIIHRQGRQRGIKALVHWNPASINNTSFDVATLYPGDVYVDVISTDIYSAMYPLDLTDWSTGASVKLGDRAAWAAIPANRRHFWRTANASRRIPNPKIGNWGWSVSQTIDMAKLHNKPLGIDETGTGNTGRGLGSPDDPEFPRFLAGILAEARSQGVTIRNVNIWDSKVSDGDWDFKSGGKPLAAAAWAACFGNSPAPCAADR